MALVRDAEGMASPCDVFEPCDADLAALLEEEAIMARLEAERRRLATLTPSESWAWDPVWGAQPADQHIRDRQASRGHLLDPR